MRNINTPHPPFGHPLPQGERGKQATLLFVPRSFVETPFSPCGRRWRVAPDEEYFRLFIFLLLLFISPILFAAPAQNIYNFNTVEQQTQFNDLTQNLRCLVCQNQTLADSNASLAQDLRGQIFQMVQSNKSNQYIKDYLIHRYGNYVTYNPPFIPSTYLLWGLPVVLLLIGLLIVRRLSS